MNGDDLKKIANNDSEFKGYVVAKLERLPIMEEKIDSNTKRINYVYAWAAGVGTLAAIGYEWVKSKIT